MSTKLQELRDGCFHAAMDDEPIFVLLARDPGAPGTVRGWADRREHMIKRGERPASDMAKVVHARQTADQMEAWRIANDGAWRGGLFDDPAPRRLPAHHVERQSDEYACSCGKRWDAADGEDHP